MKHSLFCAHSENMFCYFLYVISSFFSSLQVLVPLEKHVSCTVFITDLDKVNFFLILKWVDLHYFYIQLGGNLPFRFLFCVLQIYLSGSVAISVFVMHAVYFIAIKSRDSCLIAQLMLTICKCLTRDNQQLQKKKQVMGSHAHTVAI